MHQQMDSFVGTIRARPQHNPVHRHTVDRHLVQTVAEVRRYLTRVDRPDILLLACLFHDIGKLPGAGVHHAARGAPIAVKRSRRSDSTRQTLSWSSTW